MTDQPDQTQPEQAETKKVSLADAAKRMLAQKKQAQPQGKGQGKMLPAGDQTRKSQQTKKPNNQRKRMGV